VELVNQSRQLVRRRSSGGDNHEQDCIAADDSHSSADSSMELGGDSSTQLIREGLCRSDEHVD
jgi:hypothetical protein